MFYKNDDKLNKAETFCTKILSHDLKYDSLTPEIQKEFDKVNVADVGLTTRFLEILVDFLIDRLGAVEFSKLMATVTMATVESESKCAESNDFKINYLYRVGKLHALIMKTHNEDKEDIKNKTSKKNN